ncbi:MAG: hypothetical protein R3F54_11095 [Alphaproteobacteria bacterium]
MGDRASAMGTDSATRFGDEHRRQVVVCGSHGGLYCGYLAAAAGLRAVILNDAGGGLDRAGMASLDYGERLGMAAAMCAHDSARIGDGEDMLVRGRISGANEIAAAAGVEAGMPVAEAAECLKAAPLQAWSVRPYREARHVFASEGEGPSMVCLDSVSLVTDEDIGRIVLTGSHGGLMGGRPEAALKVDAVAAIFNDAGVGVDRAGLGRLDALDRRGIVGATVDTMTARIGDGLSTYRDGRLSYVNDRAASFGLEPGMTAKEAVERLRAKGES